MQDRTSITWILSLRVPSWARRYLSDPCWLWDSCCQANAAETSYYAGIRLSICAPWPVPQQQNSLKLAAACFKEVCKACISIRTHGNPQQHCEDCLDSANGLFCCVFSFHSIHADNLTLSLRLTCGTFVHCSAGHNTRLAVPQAASLHILH